jgi:hypothetical protein
VSRAAANVRRSKERYPENYCAHPRCLWRTFDARTGKRTPCPRHPVREDRGPAIGQGCQHTYFHEVHRDRWGAINECDDCGEQKLVERVVEP